jgi:hypothetical protein
MGFILKNRLMDNKLYIMYFSFMILFFFISSKCTDRETTFCKGLDENEIHVVKHHVSGYLSTLDPKEDTYINFEKIEEWLKSNPCIASAKFIPRIIETRPPIAQFRIKLNEDKANITSYILKISFDTNYKFYQLLKDDKK